ncbi:hypothetical protein KJ865_11105, partial [Myxococcota bacterium]|nr:hypothetical protein [Myxococcota bacterium]
PAEGASENQADWVDTELVCGKTLSVSEEKRTWNLKQRDCPAGAVTTGGRPVACYVCGSVASGVGKVRIEGLENTVEYTVSVVAVDDFNNPSEQSEAVTGIPMPTMDFAEAYKAAGGDASGEYCFIGSTVFGGKTHFALTPLRRFRDSILLPFSPTRKLVRWYYANGGTWAKAMEGSGVKGQALLALLKLLFSLMALLLALPHWFFVCAAAIFFMNSFYSMRVRLRG